VTVPAGLDISQPPSAFEIAADRIFPALYARGCVVHSHSRLLRGLQHRTAGAPSIRSYGLGFLSGTAWDSNRAEFGILPAIVVPCNSSILGLAIGTVFGLAIAIFLSEGFLSSGLDNRARYLRLSE